MKKTCWVLAETIMMQFRSFHLKELHDITAFRVIQYVVTFDEINLFLHYRYPDRGG